MPEKIVIAEFDLDMDAAIKDTIRLKEEVELLKVQTTKAKAEQGELSSEYIQYSAALKNAQSDLKTQETLIQKVNQATNTEIGTIKRLESQNAALRNEQRNLNLATEDGVKRNKEIVKQINANTAAISTNSDEQKRGWMNVGQYSKALQSMPFASTINGFMGMVKASWAFIATPLGALIGLIAAGIAGLVSVFKTFDPLLDKIAQGAAALGAAFTWLKESVIGLFTGQKAHNESMRDAIKAAIALKKAEQELEEQNVALTVSEARAKRQIDELLLQSKDRTKSEKERSALIDEALKVEEQAYNKRKKIADEELRIAQGKIITGRNLSKEEIENLKAGGVEAAFQLQQKKGITDDEIKTLADALTKQETILNESVNLREKALNRQAALEEKAQAEAEKAEAKRLKAIEDANAKREKEAEKEAKRKEKEAQDALKRAEEAVDLMDYELLKWQLTNKEKLSSSETLTEELIANEDKRLSEQATKESAILKTQLDNKLITQTEYDSRLLTLEDEHQTAIQDLRIQYDEQEKQRKIEAAQTNFENEQALFDENVLAQLDKQRAANEQKKAEELKTAEKIGADKSLIEKKYSKANIILNRAERDAKLSLAQGFASNIATIAGENTKVGKAAAVAAATINTYQAATGAYAALAPIPIVGPALGIAAAAAAVISGISNVKKILATQPGSTPSAGSDNAQASQPQLTSSLQSANTDIGAGIVSRNTETGQASQGSQVQSVLVVDKVTNAQKVESNKADTATI